MSNIRFFFNNLADTANLVENSEATGFPAENIQHPFRTKVWRTNSSGKANVVFNFTSAVGIRSVAIANYSFISQPSTLKLQFASSSAFGTATTEGLTWAARPTTYGNEAVIVKTFTTQDVQFVKFKVGYDPGGTKTDFDIGRIHLGGYFEPTLERLAESDQEFQDFSYTDMTVDGQKHSDELALARSKRFSFMVAAQAQWDEFQRMVNKVKTSKDFFVSLDPDNKANEMTWYGRFANIPRMSRIPGVGFRVDCDFKEAK